MVRQIGPHFQEPSMIVLQERIHRLEERVEALSDAVQYLMRELDRRSSEPVEAEPVEALMPEPVTEAVPHRV